MDKLGFGKMIKEERNVAFQNDDDPKYTARHLFEHSTFPAGQQPKYIIRATPARGKPFGSKFIGETKEELTKLHGCEVLLTEQPYDGPLDKDNRISQFVFCSDEEREAANGPDACGYCGSTSLDGKELLRCAKCNYRKYCGRDCQKKHWRFHKTQCARLAVRENGGGQRRGAA